MWFPVVIFTVLISQALSKLWLPDNSNTWTRWSECSVSCGGGSRNRTTFCYDIGFCRFPRKFEKQSCNSKACKRVLPAECNKPKVVGHCKAAIKRFFYNSDTDKCQMFIFCGHGGNSNNFKTLQDCQEKCTPGVNETQGCVHNGVTYKVGETFLDDCNTCHCGNYGMASCTKKGCLRPTTKPKEEFPHWGQWNMCSVSCGVGTRLRTRVVASNLTHEISVKAIYTEREPCHLYACLDLTQWRKWGACSVSCGGGIRYRTRMFSPNATHGSHQMKHAQRQSCSVNACPDERESKKPSWVCLNPKDEGRCIIGTVLRHVTNRRYFYNLTTRQCQAFWFGNCGGNQNNFMSFRECMSTCEGVRRPLPVIDPLPVLDPLPGKRNLKRTSEDHEKVKNKI